MLSPNRLYILLTLCAICGGAIILLAQQSTPLLETSKDMLFIDEAYFAEGTSTRTTPQSEAPVSQGKVTLPIVVYHIVRPAYDNDSKAVRALAQTPDVFDAQMKYLGDAGYHPISFVELEKYFSDGRRLPTKPIIISFDDGWSNQFEYAFPILQKYHYTATFFVFTNAIGRKGFITWDELHTLVASGMSIGSHSLSHPYMTRMSDKNALWNEIALSKLTLEKKLGITVTTFAYPFGMHNAEICSMVQEAGYHSARGDYWNGPSQSLSRLYTLSALNAPTTTEAFARSFP